MLDIKLITELQQYIDNHTIHFEFDDRFPPPEIRLSVAKKTDRSQIEDYIKETRKPSFRQVLFSLIDKKGVNDADIYKRAGLDRRHFSKIRSNPDYHIGKNTAIALALALQLNPNETETLLHTAGYFLSMSDTSDLVIKFCLEKKIYDVYTVNQALEHFSQKPLIGLL